MKKLLGVIFLIFTVLPVFSADWVEIFEKKYIDVSSIEVNEKSKIISFWVKSLRKDAKEKFLEKDYWYSIDKWNISCFSKKTRIESINVYDLKEKLVYSDDYIPSWDNIIPDSYADGFYRLFCIVPFNENPLINVNLYNE